MGPNHLQAYSDFVQRLYLSLAGLATSYTLSSCDADYTDGAQLCPRRLI